MSYWQKVFHLPFGYVFCIGRHERDEGEFLFGINTVNDLQIPTRKWVYLLWVEKA